jgi:hypothetical protein
VLEKKSVTVENFAGRAEAHHVIQEAIQLYRKSFK